MRGDNVVNGETMEPLRGSPPHAWGQYPGRREENHQGRFTPTCVGTIFYDTGEDAARTVHPHMRGDNWFAKGCTMRTDGSPPHAWGQCKANANPKQNRRFTPTCVGTMFEPLMVYQCGSVHPHMRGDNVRRGAVPGQRCRFTPTCVGTIDLGIRHDSAPPVHPHMRGDNGTGCIPAASSTGSPPHAWGQCPAGSVYDNVGRFTPTCVGTIPPDAITGRKLTGSPPHAWGQLHRMI